MKRLFVVVSIGLAVALVVGSTSAAPASRPSYALSDSLIAYWKLDEASGVRLDELSGCGGGGCDLTDNNTVGQAAGIISNSALFASANNEYLSRADHADLSTGDIDFTLSAWVYFNSFPTVATILSRSSASGPWEYLLHYDNSLARIRFTVYPANGSSSAGVSANSFGAPSLNTWYYVVAWHDAANNQIGVSVNNTADTVAVSNALMSDTGVAFTVGSDAVPGFFFNGRVDEVGFWKRVLSGAERTLLYNSGAGCTYPFSACEATPTPTVTHTATVTNTPAPGTPTVTFTPAPPTLTPTPTVTNIEGVSGSDMNYYFSFYRNIDVLIAFFFALLILVWLLRLVSFLSRR